MTAFPPATADQLLLRELVDGLSARADGPDLSIGLVGGSAHAPQPPGHCLECCLAGDPGAIAARGCAVLTGASRNDASAASRSGERCPKGFRVATEATTIGGTPATLLAVQGPRDAPRGTDGHPDLLAQLDSATRLVQRVAQALEENAGFAQEALQNYEQLNLIFDLTQQIAQVTDARRIEELIRQRIAQLLATPTVRIVPAPSACPATEDDEDTPPDGPGPSPDPEPVAGVLQLVRETRQVQVYRLDDQQVIAGPLIRLNNRVDVVLAIRPPGRSAFTSGDMMLVESVLAFGGQILSNSELHERMRALSQEVTRALVAAIDKKDHYTSGHSERGGFLTRLTAEELGVPPAEQQIMEWAGLLHDIGKIGIPEEILCKPGKLTREEFAVIQRHPRMGYEILKPIAGFNEVLDGVLYHHEYPDGSGYPEGLVGEQIPLVARIIHVVDMFDALTSNRAYRPAFSVANALDIIRAEKGVRVDAQVAEAFFRALAAYRRRDPHGFAARFGTLPDPEPEHVRS